MMKFTGPASAIEKGDSVTYCGSTFVPQSITLAPSGLLRFEVAGRNPEYIWGEREVTIERIEQPHKPFAVYTRDYDEEGNCDKRVFRFKTAKQQIAFIRRTNRCITFVN